jgi:hypothetical protein
MRLGRHQELDSRSLRFLAPPPPGPIKPARWLSPLPILDQGDLGSCVGNTATEHIAQLFGATDLGQIKLNGFDLTGDAAADETFAREVYHRCTVADGFPGDWPPDDTGSSGLAACKVLKAAGLITDYVHATTRQALGGLLQSSSVMFGGPWFSSWFSPKGDGAFVDDDPNWEASGVAGGHEWLIEALEAWDDDDPAKCIIVGRNHWRQTWGASGRFRMRLSTYERIKSQVDLQACRRGNGAT